jgi:hypothetical protein
MLAIAAAVALNTSSETYQNAIETLLDKLILRGLILDRGQQGELYSRLLLMLARDKASVCDGCSFVMPEPISREPTVQAVQLSKFLQTLLGPELGISDDVSNKAILRTNLLEATSNVWINFTHFVQLSEPIDEVTPSMLLKAWSSGYAFQYTFYQAVIDGFFVGYEGALDEPFDIDNLSIIPWRTKANSKAANLALARELTAPFVVTTDGSGIRRRRKRELIVILMDLAASSAFGRAEGPLVDLQFDKPEHPTGKGDKWGGYARNDEEESIRFCLDIRGHGPRTYPVLQDFEDQFDQLFQRSLACAQPEFIQFATKMERAMERFKLEV